MTSSPASLLTLAILMLNVAVAEAFEDIMLDGTICDCQDETPIQLTHDSNYVLTSPRYPYSYCSNLACSWTFTGPAGYRLRISFDDFETVSREDFVSVYNGNQASKPLERCSGTSCGIATSASDTMRIEFTTDQFGDLRGFKSLIAPVSRNFPEYCGGAETLGVSSRSGRMMSFNGKRPMFSNIMRCVWYFTTSSSQGLIIKISDFNLPDTTSSFKIYRGRTTSNSYLIQGCSGLFCSEVKTACPEATVEFNGTIPDFKNPTFTIKASQISYPEETCHAPLSQAASRQVSVNGIQNIVVPILLLLSLTCLMKVSINDKEEVCAVRLGVHPSFINGKPIPKGGEIKVSNKERLELIRGQFPFELVLRTPKMEARNTSPWQTVAEGLLVYTPPGMESSSKIAGFDLDGTIIATKSGRVFAKDEFDWKFLFSEVPGSLRKIKDNGYKVVIFTNQKGIYTGKTSQDSFKRKVDAILAKIPVPVQVFVSSGIGQFRKPMTGMWKELMACNDGIEISIENSFYVGDAAGRPAGPNRKKDHSLSDRLFAMNIGMKFLTPEEFFLKKNTEKFELPAFNPKSIFETRSLLEPSGAPLISSTQELIIMVGYPGSGKSSFVETNLAPKGIEIVSRDKLKTWQACVTACSRELKRGKSVVVDNTNPEKEARKRYLDIAKEHGISARCFIMNVSKQQALHNVRYRLLIGADDEHKNVNDIIVHGYEKKLEPPTLDEGFSDIVKVNFIPAFEDPSMEDMYSMYLLEK